MNTPKTSDELYQNLCSHRDHSHRLERAQKIALIGMAIVLLLCCGIGIANAQTAPTFDCTKKTGESPLATSCTWNSPAAATCIAGGAGSVAAWSGSVPTSGTRNLTGIGVQMTLTLSCSTSAVLGKTRLDWTHDGKNTDGSALTNLGGWTVLYGTSASALTQTLGIAVPAARNYNVDSLSTGTWFFSLKAQTTGCFATPQVGCAESALSNVASKAITATPAQALPVLSVTLTPFTVPTAPTNLTATDAIAYEIRLDPTGKLLAQRIGLVRPGTLCASEERQSVDGIEYFRVDRALVDVVNFSNGADAWVPVVYAKCG